MVLKSVKNNKTLKPSNFKDVFFPYELVPATRSPLPSNRFLKDLTNVIRIQKNVLAKRPFCKRPAHPDDICKNNTVGNSMTRGWPIVMLFIICNKSCCTKAPFLQEPSTYRCSGKFAKKNCRTRPSFLSDHLQKKSSH